MANEFGDYRPFTDLPDGLRTRDIAYPRKHFDLLYRAQMETGETREETVCVKESRPVRLTLWQALAAWVRGDNSNVTK